MGRCEDVGSVSEDEGGMSKDEAGVSHEGGVSKD